MQVHVGLPNLLLCPRILLHIIRSRGQCPPAACSLICRRSCLMQDRAACMNKIRMTVWGTKYFAQSHKFTTAAYKHAKKTCGLLYIFVFLKTVCHTLLYKNLTEDFGKSKKLNRGLWKKGSEAVRPVARLGYSWQGSRPSNRLTYCLIKTSNVTELPRLMLINSNRLS